MKTTTHGLRLRHIATCLSAALALSAADETIAVTRNVSSCLDDGTAGTLRQVVGIATSGDTVDLSGLPLACSTITLTSGEISIPQSDLTLAGPTARTLTITTNQNGRILHHTGLGTISLNDLTLSKGRYYSLGGTARGGCISSALTVVLSNSTVTGCMAVAGSGSALGGAIYATHLVKLLSSQVTGSAAYTYGASSANGGGIYAYEFQSSNSTVSGNSCSTAPGGIAAGGGAGVVGQLSLVDSTVDSNSAAIGGGIFFVGNSQALFSLLDSTISGNSASVHGGGIAIGTFNTGNYSLFIRESTVAFNSAPKSAGIDSAHSVYAQSSIIARNANTSACCWADLYIQGSGNTLKGDSNLIISSNLSLPDTLTSDPRLVPLSNHGGKTRTHALSLGSPTIDHGHHVLAQQADDQRGSGFSRVVNGTADIGAYERQVNDDEIFYEGFD